MFRCFGHTSHEALVVRLERGMGLQTGLRSATAKCIDSRFRVATVPMVANQWAPIFLLLVTNPASLPVAAGSEAFFSLRYLSYKFLVLLSFR